MNPEANAPLAVATGSAVDPDDEPTTWEMGYVVCERCGGDGSIEYDDAGPDVWGEDCPSEMNHLVECPACRGQGVPPNSELNNSPDVPKSPDSI